MTRIEKVFVDMGNMKTPTTPYLVKMGIDGPTTTALVNRQFGLIHTESGNVKGRRNSTVL